MGSWRRVASGFSVAFAGAGGSGVQVQDVVIEERNLAFLCSFGVEGGGGAQRGLAHVGAICGGHELPGGPDLVDGVQVYGLDGVLHADAGHAGSFGKGDVGDGQAVLGGFGVGRAAQQGAGALCSGGFEIESAAGGHGGVAFEVDADGAHGGAPNAVFGSVVNGNDAMAALGKLVGALDFSGFKVKRLELGRDGVGVEAQGDALAGEMQPCFRGVKCFVGGKFEGAQGERQALQLEHGRLVVGVFEEDSVIRKDEFYAAGEGAP